MAVTVMDQSGHMGPLQGRLTVMNTAVLQLDVDVHTRYFLLANRVQVVLEPLVVHNVNASVDVVALCVVLHWRSCLGELRHLEGCLRKGVLGVCLWQGD